MTVVLADTWQTARKAHRCDVCRGLIGPGDRYHRQRQVEGDGPGVWKGHALCDTAALIAHREADLWPDEWPDETEVRDVRLRFWTALAGMLTGHVRAG